MKRDWIFGYYWVVAHIKHIDIQYNDKPNWREVVTSPTVTVIQKREKLPRSVYIRDSRVDLIHNTTHPTGRPCPRCGESWPRCPPSSPPRARCSRAASTGASRRRRNCGSPGSPDGIMLMWSKHPSFNCLIHFYTRDRYFVGNGNIALWYVGNVDKVGKVDGEGTVVFVVRVINLIKIV